MTATHQSHDKLVIKLLQESPDFVNEYLAASFEEMNEPGGQEALLAALRQIAEAQGMASIATRAGVPRESVYRALSPKGNPTIKTFLAIIQAAGLKLAIQRPGKWRPA